MEEPLGTVGCAVGAVISSCILILFSSSCQSTRSACRGITHHRTISFSLHAPAAPIITSWVARPPGAHHKQQQVHIISLLLTLHISRCFSLDRQAGHRGLSSWATDWITLYLTFQVRRAGGKCSSLPWSFDLFYFLVLERSMGLGYSPLTHSAFAPPF